MNRWAIRILVATAILFLSSEVGLRILTGENSRWSVLLGADKQYDPVVQFRFKPHHQLTPGIITNELGYMAPEGLPHKRRAGTLRLIYLGDSNTASGNENSDPYRSNYPQQVQDMLTAAGFHVETINAAVPGYTSENARALFETELSRFDADYFFVYLGWNDLFHYGPESLPLERVERAGYQLNPIQRVLSHVYSLRMLFATEFLLSRYQPTVNAALDERERTLYDNYRPQHFYNNLHAILRLAKKRYPHVYVMTMATITNGSPTPDELRKAHFPKGMSKNVHKLDIAVTAYNEAIRTVARDEDVPVLDFFDLFNSHESRTLLVDSCHFLPKGAARAARLIANEIEAREPPRMAAVEH